MVEKSGEQLKADHNLFTMHTPHGYLTYCTNIHAGESWDDHFAALQQNIPDIKKRICNNQAFGIGESAVAGKRNAQPL
jgi:hypothetical protein